MKRQGCGRTLGHGENCCEGNLCSHCSALFGMSNPFTPRIPCGRTTGHGESCQEGYLCGSCERLSKLRGGL